VSTSSPGARTTGSERKQGEENQQKQNKHNQVTVESAARAPTQDFEISGVFRPTDAGYGHRYSNHRRTKGCNEYRIQPPTDAVTGQATPRKPVGARLDFLARSAETHAAGVDQAVDSVPTRRRNIVEDKPDRGGRGTVPHVAKRRIGGTWGHGDVGWALGVRLFLAVAFPIGAGAACSPLHYDVPEVPTSPSCSSTGISVITFTPYRPHSSSILERSVSGTT
jgi:hypothetical protein